MQSIFRNPIDGRGLGRSIAGAAILAMGATVAPQAHAGGISLIGFGGTHTDKTYFYSNADPDTFEDDEPVIFDDYNDYEQYSITQTIPQAGFGGEVVLGDRDDLITGSVRLLYQQDFAQTDPAELTTSVPTDFVVSAHRDKARHIGIGLIGLNFGLVEFASDRFRVEAVGLVGSGFITLDHTEFFTAGVGPGIVYKAGRQVHVFGEMMYMARFQQRGWQHQGNINLGVRYYFD